MDCGACRPLAAASSAKLGYVLPPVSHDRSPKSLATCTSSADRELCLFDHVGEVGGGGASACPTDEDAVCIDEDDDDLELPSDRTVMESGESGRFWVGLLLLLSGVESLLGEGFLFLEPAP